MLVRGEPGASDLCALVCDDDRVARSVISNLIEARGGRVLAETDRATTAVELIERFEPGLVVCDMSLASGSGMDIIRFLAERPLPCQVVVFTSFDEMVSPLEGFAVRVVTKPDFERLERALDAAILDATDTVVGRERRQLLRSTPNPGLRQDSGLDDPSEFYRQLAEAVRGDVLLTVRVAEADMAGVTGALRRAVRVQDLLIRRHDELTALLIGGGPAGAPAVLRRLATTYPSAIDGATVVELDPTLKDPSEAFIER